MKSQRERLEASKKKETQSCAISERTLERTAERIPKMLEARRNGKTAFMIMDKVIIYDRSPCNLALCPHIKI